MAKDNLARPEGLSSLGNKAYDLIIETMKARGVGNDDVGCKVFYSPSEWRTRGEEYGNKSELIVVYDGGKHRSMFNMDACYDGYVMMCEFCNDEASSTMKPYDSYEAMQASLGTVGLFFEECTGWYCAVYKV